jgi:hypothetical protein
MAYLCRLAGRGIAMVAAIAFLGASLGGLAGCAQSAGSGVAEGSSSPPSVGSIYVYPPPNLQVYD